MADTIRAYAFTFKTEAVYDEPLWPPALRPGDRVRVFGLRDNDAFHYNGLPAHVEAWNGARWRLRLPDTTRIAVKPANIYQPGRPINLGQMLGLNVLPDAMDSIAHRIAAPFAELTEDFVGGVQSLYGDISSCMSSWFVYPNVQTGSWTFTIIVFGHTICDPEVALGEALARIQQHAAEADSIGDDLRKFIMTAHEHTKKEINLDLHEGSWQRHQEIYQLMRAMDNMEVPMQASAGQSFSTPLKRTSLSNADAAESAALRSPVPGTSPAGRTLHSGRIHGSAKKRAKSSPASPSQSPGQFTKHMEALHQISKQLEGSKVVYACDDSTRVRTHVMTIQRVMLECDRTRRAAPSEYGTCYFMDEVDFADV